MARNSTDERTVGKTDKCRSISLQWLCVSIKILLFTAKQNLRKKKQKNIFYYFLCTFNFFSGGGLVAIDTVSEDQSEIQTYTVSTYFSDQDNHDITGLAMSRMVGGVWYMCRGNVHIFQYFKIDISKTDKKNE